MYFVNAEILVLSASFSLVPTTMANIVKALSEVQEYATQVQKLIKDMAPLCEEAYKMRINGVSLLNVKYATLMRYNLNLTKLATARVCGDSINELAAKLVEDFVVLSKLRPIERKLQRHVDMLLSVSLAREDNGHSIVKGADSQLRPNPTAVVVDDGESYRTGINKGDVYRPPRLAEVVFDGTVERRRQRKQLEHERFQERAMRSEDIREMVAEVKGLPEEVAVDELVDTSKSARAIQRLRKENERKRQYEEDHFTRLIISNKDRKRRRDIESAVQAAAFDRASDYAGLSAMADRVMDRKSKKARVRNGSAHVDDRELQMHRLDELFDGA